MNEYRIFFESGYPTLNYEDSWKTLVKFLSDLLLEKEKRLKEFHRSFVGSLSKKGSRKVFRVFRFISDHLYFERSFLEKCILDYDTFYIAVNFCCEKLV